MAKTAISFLRQFMQKSQHFIRLQTNSRKKNVNHVVYRFSEREPEVFPERITVA